MQAACLCTSTHIYQQHYSPAILQSSKTDSLCRVQVVYYRYIQVHVSMQIQSTFLRSDEGLVQDARDSGSFVTKPTTLHPYLKR